MLLDAPIRAAITYEVFPEDCDAPQNGDTYLDPRGKKWTVRDVKPARGYVLRNPPPPVDGFQVTFEAESAVQTLKPGETMVPIRGIRCSGPGWSGHIILHENPPRGFGQVTKGDVTYSWLLRVMNDEFLLRIGPKVEREPHFAGGVYRMTRAGVPLWQMRTVVTDALADFVAG